MIVLRIEEPAQAPRVLPVVVLHRALGIGRAPDNAVRLTDPRVSARHCELIQGPEGYQIVDCGSSNGVRVGGRRIEGPTRLVEGTVIHVGATTITVQSAPEKSKDEFHTLEFDLAAVTRRMAEAASGERRVTAASPSSPSATVIIDNEALRRELVVSTGAPSLRPSSSTGASAPTRSNETLYSLHGLATHTDGPVQGRATLRVVSGADDQRTHVLDYGQVLIGRGSHCDIALDDLSISREHARITVEQGGVFIEDLSAQRRTRVNNRRFEGRQRLADGDLIRISRVILEFSGGWTDATGEMMSIVSRFVVGEQVFEQPSLSLGSDRRCDVVLADDSIEPEHVRIERLADGHFRIIDRSTHGLLLDGRSIAEGRLRDGARVGFGQIGLRVSITGIDCRLDFIDTTPRSIEAFVGSTGEQSAAALAVTPPPVAGAAPIRRAAVWRPPGDVQRGPWDRRLIVFGLALAVIASVAFVLTPGDDGLVTQPVSPAHAGAAFLEASGGAECAACHTHAGPTVSQESCVACHREQPARPAHATQSDATAPSSASLGCLDCHAEHPSPATDGRFPTPTMRCADAGCHPTRHRALAEATPAPPPFDTVQLARLRDAAPTIDAIGAERFLWARRPAGTAALHALHGGIERRCVGCHGSQAGEIDAATSCMRCHTLTADLDGDACGKCHSEHGTPPPRAREVQTAGGGGGLGVGAAFGLSLVLLALWTITRRWSDPAADPINPPEPPPPDPKDVIHIFRSLCVGSKACVDACPYRVFELAETVIERDGEVITERFATVANFQSCNECGICQDVCAPQALVRAPPGAPVPGIERPDIDVNFMTTVSGMYLIGQAAGVSFVRNAINLGARTVQHILHSGLTPGAAAGSGWQTDIAIVGAGPAGLSAAMTAAEVGLRALVLERGDDFAPNIRAFHKGKKVQHQPASVRAIGTLWMRECTREELLEAWGRQLGNVKLDLRFRHTVTRIEPVADPRRGAGFVITCACAPGQGPAATVQITAARVVLALGGGDPRRVTIPGADLPKVMTACVDPDVHDGARVCVYGGGNSALEVAAACAEANGGRNEVRLVYRGSKFVKASARNRQRIESLVAAGRLILHLDTVLVRVDAHAITLQDPNGAKTTWPNTHVYTMLGYERPKEWLEQQGVSFSEQPRDWSPAKSDDLRFMSTRGES
ncbi:MAG: FHA domain-containing protein [Myxococcales bacterium]|nr:FHA domain-containing protein [Myxococcales bacterium]